MAQYTVQAGDTLWSIAERCYGHGYLWQRLADCNPLARAGVLYEGQRIDLPPLSPTPSLADNQRIAQPLGHLPVQVKLDGSGPLFRFDGFGSLASMGLVGELTFHRRGAVQLGQLTHNRLLGYRMEQLAWARELFVEHFCQAREVLRNFVEQSTGPSVPRYDVHWSGLGYNITGRIGEWRVVNLQPNPQKRMGEWRATLVLKPAVLFHGATLVLEEDGSEIGGHERLLPLGRVLRAACPQLISPASLWVLTRDRAGIPLAHGAAISPLESVAPYEQNGEPAESAEPATKSESPKKKRKLVVRKGPKKKKKPGKKP